MSVGTIQIVLGCMFSGKTTEVIKEYQKWSSIHKNALCINYSMDTRYGNDNNLYTHNLTKISCQKVLNLSQVDEDLIKNADIILINEGQFFTDLIEYCLLWCETFGKNIIVSGLDGDFKRKPFGQILDLIPYADSVTKLNAFCNLCNDGTIAHFTLRLSHESDQVVIGNNNYMAVCRKHYLDK
jgi:thymidine kinase